MRNKGKDVKEGEMQHVWKVRLSAVSYVKHCGVARCRTPGSVMHAMRPVEAKGCEGGQSNGMVGEGSTSMGFQVPGGAGSEGCREGDVPMSSGCGMIVTSFVGCCGVWPGEWWVKNGLFDNRPYFHDFSHGPYRPPRRKAVVIAPSRDQHNKKLHMKPGQERGGRCVEVRVRVGGWVTSDHEVKRWPVDARCTELCEQRSWRPQCFPELS